MVGCVLLKWKGNKGKRNYINTMGKNRQSIGGGTSSTELTWESAKDDPEKLAELANMTFKETEDGGYLFTDKETGLELHLTPNMISLHKDDGYVNTIVKLVSELPELNKRSTPIIYIVGNDDTGNYGQHATIRNKVSKEYVGHGVRINSSAFKDGDVELRRILYHETEHGYDYLRGGITELGGISQSKAFKDALKADGPATGYGDLQKYKRNKYGHITGVYSEKSLFTKGSNYLVENYAEAGSIVQLQMAGYGSHKITLPSGDSVSVNEWCNSHPNLYRVVKNEINNFDVKEFNKENVTHPMVTLKYTFEGTA